MRLRCVASVGSQKQRLRRQALGFDSMGACYIGGIVEVSLPWRLAGIDTLTAVAGNDPEEPWAPPFDIVEGENCPGQLWQCYRSQKENEPAWNKDLRQRMVDLLTPSTSDETLEALQAEKDQPLLPISSAPATTHGEKGVARGQPDPQRRPFPLVHFYK